MNFQNKIKIDIILSLIILFSFFAFLGLMGVAAEESGTLGNTWILHFIAEYIVFLFPLVLLCVHLNFSNPYFLILVLEINILLYAFGLIKLFTKKLSNSKKYNPFGLTIISIYFILSIVLVYVVSLYASNS
jgi:hypothetical protein